MNESISVIIPLYNAVEFLPLAVKSIFAQDIAPLEVLIVDDGSTDNSLEVAEQLAKQHPQIRIWSQSNSGPSAARNFALRQSRGEIILFLDADDEFLPGSFSFQLGQLRLAQEAGGEHCVVRGCLWTYLKSEGEWVTEGDPQDLFVVTSGIFPCGIFDYVGHFDESLRGCEDMDWWIRADELGVHVSTHQRAIIYYRRHDSNTTLDTALMNSARLKMFKKRIDRKRALANREVTGS